MTRRLTEALIGVLLGVVASLFIVCWVLALLWGELSDLCVPDARKDPR